MKKFCKIMRSKTGTLILFAAAAVLLAFSSVGGARAALIYSQTYRSQVRMDDIGVALIENGVSVDERTHNPDTADGNDWHGSDASGALLTGMLAEEPDKKLKLGKEYPEVLQVQNTGTINEYVRVTIYKYWMRDGEKDNTLDPALIDLNLLTGNGWSIDESSSTDERTVLYYSPLVTTEGDASVTAPFSDTITINGKVADIVDQRTETAQDGNTTITTTYAYDGATFVLEAQADAVQDHNADQAVWSSWGRRANVSNNTLQLAD